LLLRRHNQVTTWPRDVITRHGCFKIELRFHVCSITPHCLPNSRPKVSALPRQIPSAAP
jgi:hypothetical protein